MQRNRRVCCRRVPILERDDAGNRVEPGVVHATKRLDGVVDVLLGATLVGDGNWRGEGEFAALVLDVDLDRVHADFRVGQRHDRLEQAGRGDGVRRGVHAANVVGHGDAATDGLFRRALTWRGRGGLRLRLLRRGVAATPGEGERGDGDRQKQDRNGDHTATTLLRARRGSLLGAARIAHCLLVRVVALLIAEFGHRSEVEW